MKLNISNDLDRAAGWTSFPQDACFNLALTVDLVQARHTT